MIVWTDVETTDFDERTHHLLEVAMIATDDNLVERTHTTVVIKPVGIEIDEVKMSMVVREMHEKSGLIADIKTGNGLRRHEAEGKLYDWLRDTFIDPEMQLRSIPLGGSTIAFDRRWLRQHMSGLEKLFLHRSIDVSSINELASRWAPHIFNDRPKQPRGVPHRALEDARHSIETLRYYKERGFVGGLT